MDELLTLDALRLLLRGDSLEHDLEDLRSRGLEERALLTDCPGLSLSFSSEVAKVLRRINNRGDPPSELRDFLLFTGVAETLPSSLLASFCFVRDRDTSDFNDMSEGDFLRRAPGNELDRSVFFLDLRSGPALCVELLNESRFFLEAVDEAVINDLSQEAFL